ncbi:MAG TPA: hypothetical protein PKD72_14785, partial [Gemmatales bacterium]|nr:hypothetical protein [Gemmatales bacterium]
MRNKPFRHHTLQEMAGVSQWQRRSPFSVFASEVRFSGAAAGSSPGVSYACACLAHRRKTRFRALGWTPSP